jgi:hypothetical protein
MAPTDIAIVFARPLRQDLNKPGLLNGKLERLGVRHHREIQRERREHGARVEAGRLIRTGERTVQPTVVQYPNALSVNAVGSSLWVGAGHRIQHHRPNPGQCQLAGQHQTIRTGARDDDVNHFIQSSSGPERDFIRERQPLPSFQLETRRKHGG